MPAETPMEQTIHQSLLQKPKPKEIPVGQWGAKTFLRPKQMGSRHFVEAKHDAVSYTQQLSLSPRSEAFQQTQQVLRSQRTPQTPRVASAWAHQGLHPSQGGGWIMPKPPTPSKGHQGAAEQGSLNFISIPYMDRMSEWQGCS